MAGVAGLLHRRETPSYVSDKGYRKRVTIVLVSKGSLGGTIPLVSGKLSRTFCRLVESEQFVECCMLVSHKHLYYSWVQHTQNFVEKICSAKSVKSKKGLGFMAHM